jgi:hypothetical protein
MHRLRSLVWIAAALVVVMLVLDALRAAEEAAGRADWMTYGQRLQELRQQPERMAGGE